MQPPKEEKQMSKGMQLIKRITAQAEDEEARMKKKEEQEERLK